ncbi:hypothetical protein LguiA_010280 [Lonicera macranthoides]
MSKNLFTAFILLLLFVITNVTITSTDQEFEVVQMARAGLLHAMDWAQFSLRLHGSDPDGPGSKGVVMSDCVRLYKDAEPRLAWLVSGKGYSVDDAVTWLSAAATSHRSCVDGLEEKGLVFEAKEAKNLSLVIKEALAFYGHNRNITRGRGKGDMKMRPNLNQNGGLLATWNAASAKADLVVAQDGSGNYKTINEAVQAVSRMGRNRPHRVIIYVKSGVYNERVEIKRNMNNLMFVGDGIDTTIVTSNRNVLDGATTSNSATFGVSGDRFWARDMTFENTAGPHKHQAVALSVASDLSVFYRCSFKGYQDTLLVHSLRQFYRDCHIYGTIDFIFGNAAAVFQNCDIFIRKPLDHQSNMITAQGRDDLNENTGISIINSRVAAAPDFSMVKDRFKSYLGRPWKRYSRTVVLKTELDGLIDPKGWTEWSGNFALSTLYYGEYMNFGNGASTANRVKWPGFHVLNDPREARPFTASNFIQGGSWIPVTGVPFYLEI